VTYFADLSGYAYWAPEFRRPGTRNVGWLGAGHEFPRGTPREELLDLIWDYCRISVAQTRGIHKCEFCPSGYWHHAERKGERLTLGSSEIRVFGTEDVYAAPTLIYHYVLTHHYLPPAEFTQALSEGPRPPSQEYFDRLRVLDLEWNKTGIPDADSRRFCLGEHGRVYLDE
jgi:hypothetical protein